MGISLAWQLATKLTRLLFYEQFPNLMMRGIIANFKIIKIMIRYNIMKVLTNIVINQDKVKTQNILWTTNEVCYLQSFLADRIY